MAVRLGQELHTTGLGQLLQEVNHLAAVLLQLLQEHSTDTECHAEVLAMTVNHVEHGTQSRQIAVLGGLGGLTLILIVVIILVVGTDVKEAITLQMIGLVYLKI